MYLLQVDAPPVVHDQTVSLLKISLLKKYKRRN